MHVLAIDAGSYSVKFLSSYVDKKKSTHVEMREYNILEELEENPNLSTAEEATKNIIHRIVDEVARPDSRIVLHVNPESVTTRFLTLPIKNRKKAELMIPFQLEEDIPYSLQDSHYSYTIETAKSQTLALVALTRDSEFASFYNQLDTWSSPPSVITSEPSVMDAFYSLNQVAGSFCVLDIGHRSTKAYFFYNSKLIATHVSYVGGRHIDEMIAQTYGIDATEAVIYKHQNAFVLTSGQMNEVDDNQKEFARLMEQAFKPLINDFHRWDLGFRVTHGMKLSQVFLCGGTSNIKNMANFLTEKFAVKCSLLESFEGVETSKIDLNPKSRARFTMVNMMALSLKAKGRLINLLSGRYAQAARGDLPLHTLAFLTARSTAVTLVLLIALSIQNYITKLDIKAVNNKITSTAKNPILGLTARERRLISTQPGVVESSLAKKQKTVRQQISTLQSASKIKALSPLVMISSAAAGVDVTLMNVDITEAGDVSAVFKASDVNNLNILQTKLQGISLQNVETKINSAQKTLTLTGVE
ncbi:MAG: pilus assembly protein PilM [Bacteriovoracaceae bacterium]|nr:pilus assembly protein PilM [Bacteriovoracaceae bacterium]